jgi:drug/metabolite transporter (DMT)-like permease
MRLAAIGAVQFGLMYVAYISAYGYIKAYQIAAMTIFTPLYVKLFDDALEKRFDPRAFALVLLAVGATGIIYWNRLAEFPVLTGFCLMQASNICFACGQVWYRRTRLPDGATDRSIFALLYAGAVSAAFLGVLLRGALPDIAQINSAQWLTLLYLGVVASGLCFFLWNLGVRRADITSAAICNNAKVPLGVLVSLFLFGELKGASAPELARIAAGTALIILALYLNARLVNRKS